jgi:predicted acylesterase/phospholipase RssA
MKRIGLALSGGGFRATLYHLGLVRFLRDAGLLSQVTHITSVSGGSIIAAHLVLHWDRYNGSPGEFDAAASELLSFVRLGVRNRITRRFPLTTSLRFPRWLLGRSNRQLTRTGLLEYHYQQYLYGDVSLFQLPERPQLHILTTNLSEGCLCSFHRDGLLMVRRRPGGTRRLDRIHVGLATVAMAVTASSAFPGFFPPLELTGADVGANVGEFGRQAYTDGGVFDNLGIRMFRCLERPLLADTPLCREDFVNFPAVLDALRVAGTSSQESPLRRLTQVLIPACRHLDRKLLPNRGNSVQVLPPSSGDWNGDHEQLVLSSLWHVMRHCQFHLDPLFEGLKLTEPEAEALLKVSRLTGRTLAADDQRWLNRHLLEAAFRQASGQPCFRRLNSGLDGVLVSDVGKRIEVQGQRRAGGVIRTAMRSTDILMDRVWQLEIETFDGTPGYVFAPMTEVVEPDEDPTALHPEIQRQAAKIRTDLDRFSPLEISSLARHGFCVGRKTCRARPDLFGADLPGHAPWDPLLTPHTAAVPVLLAARPSSFPLSLPGTGVKAPPADATVEARALQISAPRRIWSTLLDWRDWISYVYVPLLVPILVLMPLILVKSYQRTHRLNQLVYSLSQGSRDLQQMSRLLEGPMEPWTGESAEEVRHLDLPNFTGFEILQDSRMLDLRKWHPTAPGKGERGSLIFGYQRLKVLKQPTNTRNHLFRMHSLPSSPEAQIRFPQQELQPKLLMSRVESSVPGQTECRWEASFDFQKVPPGDFVDLVIEYLSPGAFLQRGESSTTLTYDVPASTAEMIRWLLLPEGKEYSHFRIIRYPTGMPDKPEPVKVVTEYLAEDYTILAYKLLSVDAGYTYEITWYYK